MTPITRLSATLLLHVLLVGNRAVVHSLATLDGSARGLGARAMCEWLRAGDRCTGPVAIAPIDRDDDDDDGDDAAMSRCVVTAARSAVAGEVLIRLSNGAAWSAAAAYRDRDLGPKFRDFAGKAGPGFGVVALSGALAGERIRRFRSREGLGTAPESAGYVVPSRWGAFARWLWLAYDGIDAVDASVAGPVLQGTELLIPMLDVVARRAWSADEAEAPSEEAFLSEEWARRAMFEDGATISWSRGDLEIVARSAFSLVLQRQRPPPPYLLGGVGTLIPEPFVGSSDDAPEAWPETGEPLALVPLVDDLFPNDGSVTPNSVLGSPPRGQYGSEKDCLWCVATRKIEAGERVIASDPWSP